MNEYQDQQDYTDDYIPIPQKKEDKGDFIEKIKPEKIVNEMRHMLMGEEYIDGKWVKNPDLKRIALTKRGAWELSNMLLAISSINVSISKFTEDQISARINGFMKEVMIKCISNCREYGIHDVSQLYYVKSIMMTNALAVLCQAGHGSIQELLKGSVHEVRSIRQTPEEDKQGRFRKWLGI